MDVFHNNEAIAKHKWSCIYNLLNQLVRLDDATTPPIQARSHKQHTVDRQNTQDRTDQRASNPVDNHDPAPRAEEQKVIDGAPQQEVPAADDQGEHTPNPAES